MAIRAPDGANKEMLTHIKTFVQRIVSGDFGGEVHLWDLKFKDKEGNFEVTNHRKWECHKVSLVLFKPKTSHNDALYLRAFVKFQKLS